MLLGTMEVTSPISFASPKPHFPFALSSPSSSSTLSLRLRFPPRPLTTLVAPARSSLRLSSPLAVAETLEQAAAEASPSQQQPPPPRGVQQRIDKSGRFSSPRAARELALLIAYAACLEGTDPVRLFDRRVNARREPGFVFDKVSLLKYDHMSFGGAPVEVGTEEEAEELMLQNERDSANEAEVLSAPPKLVYNRFVLRFAREILEAVVNGWDQHVLVINKIIPQNWKDEPVARILELCILHLAMAEVTAKGTRYQIVINEAVDLAKRFCDGGAPRIINGCLRTFVKDYSNTPTFRSSEPTP